MRGESSTSTLLEMSKPHLAYTPSLPTPISPTKNQIVPFHLLSHKEFFLTPRQTSKQLSLPFLLQGVKLVTGSQQPSLVPRPKGLGNEATNNHQVLQ